MIFYTVYKVTNLVNGKFYIGAHKTININDKYYGSGTVIRKAIELYGKKNFQKTVIHLCETSEEMFLKETEEVQKYIGQEQCYNVSQGGKGGFDVINNNRHLYQNPMLNKDCVIKNLESRKRKLESNPELKENTRLRSIRNLQKAVATNTGKKRPDHSLLMKKKYVDGVIKVPIKQPKYEYLVTSPDGDLFNVKGLEKWCKDRSLDYLPIWRTNRTGKPAPKGKSKGWICKKISKQ